MNTLTTDEVQRKLPQILEESTEREFLVVNQDAEPVAFLLPLPERKMPTWRPIVAFVDPFSSKLVWPEEQPAQQPVFGSCKGMLQVLVEDDEHLEDFAEYMK